MNVRRRLVLQSSVPWTCSCAECEPVVMAHLARYADQLAWQESLRASSQHEDDDPDAPESWRAI